MAFRRGRFNRDEPIIFNDPNTRTFIVTNYHETVHRSHKYIMLVLELFLHYYQIFEAWAIVFLNENYKKIINHPEF